MTSPTPYRDRLAAGQTLAKRLAAHTASTDTLVLALPRGGVPVAAEIAQALALPIDVFVVRKLGLPGNPELAMGAIASGGVRLLDESLIATEGIPPRVVEEVIERETAELQRRERAYRGDRPAPQLAGRRLILVDDGVATGYTMRVAVLALQQLRPAALTIAIPVGAPDTCALLRGMVDEFICPMEPAAFHAVGLWYDHFAPLTDEQVRDALNRAVPQL